MSTYAKLSIDQIVATDVTAHCDLPVPGVAAIASVTLKPGASN